MQAKLQIFMLVQRRIMKTRRFPICDEGPERNTLSSNIMSSFSLEFPLFTNSMFLPCSLYFSPSPICIEREGAVAVLTVLAGSNCKLVKSWEAFLAQGSGRGMEGGAIVPSPTPDFSWEASGKSDCASGFSRNFISLRLFLLTLDGGTFFFGFLRVFSAKGTG